jgi:hypothetical protein
MAFSFNTELFHLIFDNLSYLKVWIIIIIQPFLALLPDIAMKIIQRIVYPTPSDILMDNITVAREGIKVVEIQKIPTVRRIETIRKVVNEAEVKIQNLNKEKIEIKIKPDYSQLSDTMRPMINSPEKNPDNKIDEFNYNLNEYKEKTRNTFDSIKDDRYEDGDKCDDNSNNHEDFCPDADKEISNIRRKIY